MMSKQLILLKVLERCHKTLTYSNQNRKYIITHLSYNFDCKGVTWGKLLVNYINAYRFDPDNKARVIWKYKSFTKAVCTVKAVTRVMLKATPKWAAFKRMMWWQPLVPFIYNSFIEFTMYMLTGNGMLTLHAKTIYSKHF